MSKDWKAIYRDLPDEEKEKIAILRVMECSNGVIQHALGIRLTEVLFY